MVMAELGILQDVTAEENVKVCPDCGGKMEHEGGEVFCKKCGFVLE